MKLSAVSQLYQAPCFPNVRAIATIDAEEDLDQNVTALERSAKACVEPAIKWFLRKFNVDLYDVVVTFKAARLFCPVRIQWLKPTNALVESLRAFPFLPIWLLLKMLLSRLISVLIRAAHLRQILM